MENNQKKVKGIGGWLQEVGILEKEKVEDNSTTPTSQQPIGLPTNKLPLNIANSYVQSSLVTGGVDEETVQKNITVILTDLWKLPIGGGYQFSKFLKKIQDSSMSIPQQAISMLEIISDALGTDTSSLIVSLKSQHSQCMTAIEQMIQTTNRSAQGHKEEAKSKGDQERKQLVATNGQIDQEIVNIKLRLTALEEQKVKNIERLGQLDNEYELSIAGIELKLNAYNEAGNRIKSQFNTAVKLLD
jgi:hypothetical protein